MSSQSIAYSTRKQKFAEKREEVQRYFDNHSKNWLGKLLNTMSEVANANLDRDNNIQYRNQMYKVYNEFITNPKIVEASQKDSHFSVCLSFAQLFGLFIEEMNERTDEGNSVLFRPATMQSLKDTKNGPMVRRRSSVGPPSLLDSDSTGTSSSADTRILSMAVPRRSSFPNRNDPKIEFTMPPRPSDAAATQSAPQRKPSTAVTPRKRMIAVKKEVTLDGALKSLMTTPLSAMTKAPVVSKTPVKRRAPIDIGTESPVKMDEECPECGLKVKAGRLRRHLQHHTREKEEPMESSLDEGAADAMEEDNDEPAVKKPMMRKKSEESGLEMESADESAMTPGVKSAKKQRVLEEWAANLLHKKASCFKCNRECINYHQLSNHLYHNHKGAAQSHYIFDCLGCDKQFRSYRGAMGHIEQAIRKDEVCCKNKIVYLWDAKSEQGEAVATEEVEEEEPRDLIDTPVTPMMPDIEDGELVEEEENQPSPTL